MKRLIFLVLLLFAIPVMAQDVIILREGGKGYTSVVNISSNTTLTTTQCNGTIIYMTGNITATMPAVTIGLDTTFYSTDATVKYVDMNASDRLRLNGTAMDDGDKATSPGNAGNAIRIHGDSAAGYTEIGMIGGWVDGG